ncbi:hypothetical protein ABZ646_23435 [Streptomyces sp. NPDC007162]|uniref:hypothetical protein n=1 Tax=Streptomyces sp. NPDC007162 TaxID=3156917 RepID=UPI0033F9F1A0
MDTAALASIRTPGSPWEPAGPSRCLAEADRIHIADRLPEKASARAVAAGLGRSPSAHRKPGDPPQPHAHAQPRLVLPSGQARLRDFLQDHVTRRWSPEQIRHALRARFPDGPPMPPTGLSRTGKAT